MENPIRFLKNKDEIYLNGNDIIKWLTVLEEDFKKLDSTEAVWVPEITGTIATIKENLSELIK